MLTHACSRDWLAVKHDILAEVRALLSTVGFAGTTGSSALVLVGTSLLALTPAAVIEDSFALEPPVNAALQS